MAAQLGAVWEEGQGGLHAVCEEDQGHAEEQDHEHAEVHTHAPQELLQPSQGGGECRRRLNHTGEYRGRRLNHNSRMLG